MLSARPLRRVRSVRSAPRAQRGFTIVELVVAVALLALVLGLAAPAFTLWTRNAQVRTVADGLQNGLRLAQAEAVRRNRQVLFFLTAADTCTTTINATANGRYWSIRSVPLTSGDTAAAVQCGVLSDSTNAVEISGPTVLCLNSMGRQVANAAPGVGGATCTLPTSGTSQFDISASGSDRALRVLVSLGGQLRLCDPARTLSATSPDGCPA
jgi:type IV fimbrial biogenesis protein FimT